MARKGKLLAAFDAHKGRDFDALKRKKQVKAAEKRKRDKTDGGDNNEESDGLDVEDLKAVKALSKKKTDDFESFGSEAKEITQVGENDDEEEEVTGEEEAEGDEEEEDGEAEEAEAEAGDGEESDIPFSDLDASDREDTVPHQRMTINNGPALISSRKRVAIVSDRPPSRSKDRLPFHIHNSIVSSEKAASELIPDAMDDETRELMFYKIARDATVQARSLLKAENVPFTRPTDYFAEMVKTDEHMGKIKKKLYDEAANKKAAEEARKLRDAKKFGKQVQIAKEQERAKDKRDTLNKIKELKRKRKGADTSRVNEGDDLFQEINVEDSSANASNKRQRRDDKIGGAGSKRQKKDSKFGFGGRKRHAKSGDAESSADMRGFSARRMKGKPSGAGKRLGKSRRTGGKF